jgi:hypothetical protein
MNCFAKKADIYLSELIDFLKKKQLELSTNMNDGRLNSAINENETINSLNELNEKNNKEYFILEGIARDWADIYLISKEVKQDYEDLKQILNLYKKSHSNALKNKWINKLKSINKNNNLIPINIKITTTQTNDNINSKEGIYYSLTGKIYNKSNNWKTFLDSLKENLSEEEPNVDYYFLIINKKDTKDIFFNSLRRIKKFIPNGNNPPFQVKWSENKQPDKGNFSEAKRKILMTLGITLQQRANPWFIFEKNFPDYI